MQASSALLDPLLDARDVFESYLGNQYEPPGWRETLRAASGRLAELSGYNATYDLPKIADQLRRVANSDLGEQVPLVRELSQQLAAMVRKVRVPDLPRPEDDNWAF
jgi:hypothetical protein